MPGDALQVGLVFANPLGAVLQQDPVNFHRQDGPVGQELVQLALGDCAVPTGGYALPVFLSDGQEAVLGRQDRQPVPPEL